MTLREDGQGRVGGWPPSPASAAGPVPDAVGDRSRVALEANLGLAALIATGHVRADPR
jgi:hypothetical protein